MSQTESDPKSLPHAWGPPSLRALSSCAHPTDLQEKSIHLQPTGSAHLFLHLEFTGIFLGWLCTWGSTQGPLDASGLCSPQLPLAWASSLPGCSAPPPVPSFQGQTPLLSSPSFLLPQSINQGPSIWLSRGQLTCDPPPFPPSRAAPGFTAHEYIY